MFNYEFCVRFSFRTNSLVVVVPALATVTTADPLCPTSPPSLLSLDENCKKINPISFTNAKANAKRKTQSTEKHQGVEVKTLIQFNPFVVCLFSLVFILFLWLER